MPGIEAVYSRSTMRGISAFAVVGVMGFLSLNAWGQAQDPLTADALFEAGRKAADAGDFASACPKFAESYRLDPAPVTLFSVGDCEEHLGHVATAWINFKKAMELLPPKDARLAIAKKKVASLKKRIPHLTVKLAANVPAGTAVKRDGVEISASTLGIAIPTDPGKHVVLVTAPGRAENRYEVDLAEGQSREVVGEPTTEDVAPAVVPVAPPPLPPTESRPVAAIPEKPPPTEAMPIPEPLPPPASADDGSTGRRARAAGYVVTGIGVVGLIVGAVTRGVAFNEQSTIDGHCNAARFCDDTGLSAVSTAKDFQTVSTVSLALGLAAVGTGVVVILTNPNRPESSAALRPTVMPGGAGLSLSRSF
jgi:hypothetical protein